MIGREQGVYIVINWFFVSMAFCRIAELGTYWAADKLSRAAFWRNGLQIQYIGGITVQHQE